MRRLLITLLVALIPSLSFATTYFVDTSATGCSGSPCNDSNDGLTENTAWLTIAKANTTLTAADTVRIKTGTYSDQIRPTNSGTSGNLITYEAFGDGNVTLTDLGSNNSSNHDCGSIALGGRSYVKVDGLDPNQYIRVVPTSGPITCTANFTDADHCIIDSVYFDGTNCTGITCYMILFNFQFDSIEDVSQHNVFRNNRVIGLTDATSTDYVQDLLLLADNSHHNLIEDNQFDECQHVAIQIGRDVLELPRNNVIRNNIVNNTFHTAISAYNGDEEGAPIDNIYEGNIFLASAGQAGQANGAGNAIQGSSSGTIVRYNIIRNGGATDNTTQSLGIGAMTLAIGGEGAWNSDNNRFYNNTVVKNEGQWSVHDFGGGSTLLIENNKHVNNFIFDTHMPGDSIIVHYADSGQPAGSTNDRYISNVFGATGGSSSDDIINTVKGPGNYTLAEAKTGLTNPDDPEFSDWNGFANVYDATPGFTNYGADDFTLPPGNTYIDAGAYLTVVAVADTSSGTSLIVDDSLFFQGGLAIAGVADDVIAVGTVGNTVTVTATNHATNTLTLSSAVSRSDGDEVWLYSLTDGTVVLKGSAPDIGAFESEPASSGTIVGGTLTGGSVQ